MKYAVFCFTEDSYSPLLAVTDSRQYALNRVLEQASSATELRSEAMTIYLIGAEPNSFIGQLIYNKKEGDTPTSLEYLNIIKSLNTASYVMKITSTGHKVTHEAYCAGCQETFSVFSHGHNNVNAFGETLCDSCWEEYLADDNQRGLMEVVKDIALGMRSVNEFSQKDIVLLQRIWNRYKGALSADRIPVLEAALTTAGFLVAEPEQTSELDPVPES